MEKKKLRMECAEVVREVLLGSKLEASISASSL